MRCIRCGKEFSASALDGRVASISGSVLGDECTDTYYFCKDCGVYTVEVCYDNFTGTEEISVRGPLSKAEGDAQAFARWLPRALAARGSAASRSTSSASRRACSSAPRATPSRSPRR